jgi:Listeria-Bacteroides repeat domain (List_Bact_rpt).
MKKILTGTKWQRCSPALVLSVVTAAALLFFSGRAALKALAADTAPNGTYILRYLIGDGVTFDTGETDNGYPATKSIITDENRVIKTYNGIPARTGYEFVRWNVDNHNGGYASYQRNAQVALSLFAPEGEDTYVTSAQPVWRKLVTIKYEKNTDDTVTGITTPSNNTLLEGATITLNKNARREGYTLLGWSKTPTGGETIKTISEPEFTELGESGRFEITLYAVWVKNYNITYDLQNGSDTVTVMGAGLKIGEKSSGSYISTTWNGYTFVEWNTEPDGSGTGYEHRQDGVTFTEDTTLYAQWNKKYKLIYRGNGGNFGQNTVGNPISEKTQTFELPFQRTEPYELGIDPEPTKKGQLFAGWSETNDNQNAIGAIDLSHFELTSGWFTADVYAVWDDDTFIASYNANIPIGVTNHNMIDGDVDVTYSEVAGGYRIQPVAPAADGCQFVQWDYTYYQNGVLDSEGNLKPQTPWASAGGTISEGCFTNNPTKKVTISASWNKLYRMRRDYQANGDAVTGPGSTMEFAKNNPTPDFTYSVYKGDPTRDGYVFVCWSKYPDRAEEVTELAEADFNTLVDGRWEATVYAIWVKKVNLTYNGNFPLYEGEEMPSKTYAGNPNQFTIQSVASSFTLTTYETYSKGHTFINWNTKPDGSGRAYEVDDSVTFNEDTTLYAQWSRKFQLIYNENSPYSGNNPSFTNFPDPDVFSVPVSDLTDSSSRQLTTSAPLTNGFNFVNWSLSPDGSGPVASVLLKDFALAGVYKLNVYAQWTPKAFSIKYETGLPDSVTVNNFPVRDDFFYTEMEGNSSGGGYRRLPEQDPSAEGYVFKRWDHFYYDADGEKHDTGTINNNGINLHAFLKSRDGTVTARAVWSSKFTVNYYRNLDGTNANFAGRTDIADADDQLLNSIRFESNALDENGRYNGLLSVQWSDHMRTPDEDMHTYSSLGWSTSRTNDKATLLSYLTPDQFTYNAGTDRFEISVYVVWAKNAEIVYAKNMDPDSAELTKSYVYGEPVLTESNVRSPGNLSVYTEFINWNTEYDGTGTTYEPNDKISLEEGGELTLYAQLNKRFYLTFNRNWPESIPGSVINMPNPIKFVEHLNTITPTSTHELPENVPELVSTNGQKRYFIGWSLTADGEPLENDEVPLNVFTALSGYNWDGQDRYGKTVFAVWSTEPFAVEYEENFSDPSLVTDMPEDEPELPYSAVRRGYRIPDNRPQAPGCTFALWRINYTDRNGDIKTQSILPGRTMSMLYFRSSTQKVIANAQWNKNFAVVYDCGGNTDGTLVTATSDKTFTVNWNSTQTDYRIDRKSASRTAHTFVGWSGEPDSNETLTLPLTVSLDEFTLNADADRFEKRLYAVWQRKYRVNYDKNTTEYVYNLPRYNEFERFLNVNEEPLYDTIPVRKGYTFKGWALSSEATEPLADNKVPLNLTTFTLNLENNYYEATVYAVWERNANCTVTYKAGEGNGADVTDTVATGSKTTVKDGGIFTPPVGKEFDCWLCDTDGYSVTPGEEITVNDDIVYTAQWKTAYYILQYDKGEVPAITGTLPAGRSDITWADLRAGGVVISEEKPQAEGYTFTGWKITNGDDDSIFKVYDASKFGSMTDAEKQVNEALFDSTRKATAVAQWQANPPIPATYTVTYKDSENSSAIFTDTGISGDYTLLGIADTGFTAPDEKTFDGWKLVTPDDKGYPENAEAGESVNVISDVTYEAQWKNPPVITTATIHYTSGLTEDYPGYNESCASTFVINDVPTTAEYAVLDNDPQNESNPSFAPVGYTFAGWKLISGTGGSSPTPRAASGGASADGLYHEGDTVPTDALASGSVTLKAMWQVKLKYDANGGTGEIPENGEAIPVFVDSTATAASGSNLTRSGARFDHWNTEPNDNGTKFQPGQNMIMKDNTVLYAIYTDSPGDDTSTGEPDDTTFTVTYKANGGTGNVPKDENQYSAGATVPVASKGDLVRTGCTFKEWNTKPDGSGAGYKGDGSDSFVIRSDTTLYAIWLDGSGKIVPSPGTGESSLPIIIAFNAALLSLAALAFIMSNERRKTAKFQ